MDLIDEDAGAACDILQFPYVKMFEDGGNENEDNAPIVLFPLTWTMEQPLMMSTVSIPGVLVVKNGWQISRRLYR